KRGRGGKEIHNKRLLVSKVFEMGEAAWGGYWTMSWCSSSIASPLVTTVKHSRLAIGRGSLVSGIMCASATRASDALFNAAHASSSFCEFRYSPKAASASSDWVSPTFEP